MFLIINCYSSDRLGLLGNMLIIPGFDILLDGWKTLINGKKKINRTNC
jgi:hypothetical protein